MKKYFVFAAAALMTIAACTKVETDETPAKKISFQIADYASQTKAAEDPGALQGETTSFSSKAWLHANGASTGTNFFGTSSNDYTETVSYTAGTPNVWEPSEEYFWPKASDSYINFVSWYATNSKAPTTVTETAMNWGTSAAPMTIASDDNFLFADEAWRYSDNATQYTSISGVSEGVPTLFHHALAKLAFKIRLSTETASSKTIWDVEMKTASLVFGNKGYLNLANADPTSNTTRAWSIGTTYNSGASYAATSANVGWTATTGTETVTSFTTPTMTLIPTSASSSSPATSGDFVDYLAERTVMPQAIDGGVVTLALTFDIKLFHASAGAKVGDAYSTETITIAATNLHTLVGSIDNWNMNTKYTYNVTIDPVGKKVLFDPAVAEWATVNNGTNGTEIYSAN